MPRYRATITVPVPPGEAFPFVSDFRNAAAWDPRVSGAEKELAGPLAAKEVELPYEVTEVSPGGRSGGAGSGPLPWRRSGASAPTRSRSPRPAAGWA